MREKNGISTTALVIANECGKARQGNTRDASGKETQREREREREARMEGRGRRAEGSVVMGVAIERSKHCKSISRRLPALRARPVPQHTNTLERVPSIAPLDTGILLGGDTTRGEGVGRIGKGVCVAFSRRINVSSDVISVRSS